MCEIRRAVNIPASRRREEPKSKLVVAVHTLASFASARRLSSSPPVSMGANERIYHRLEQSSGFYQIRHDNGHNLLGVVRLSYPGMKDFSFTFHNG